MDAFSLQDIDSKINILRAVVESANRDIEALERVKVILIGGSTTPELPFPDSSGRHGRKVSDKRDEAIGPIEFAMKMLQGNPDKRWSPSELAIEYGKLLKSPKTSKAMQYNRLAMHGALRSLVDRDLVKKGEPDHLKVRLYWWIGKPTTPGKVALSN